MKVSTRALYCLRLMIYLADHADRQSPIRLREIAEARNLPHRYLEQLVVPLKTAGLITSVQGKLGGYVLARDGSEITALDIIEATSGPVNLLKCVEEVQECTCELSEFCPSRKMWVEMTAAITAVLRKYTLADLTERRVLELIGRGTDENGLSLQCDKPESQGEH